MGPYLLQAAIAAVHAEASSLSQTSSGRIVALDDVVRIEPSKLAALDRAKAHGERDGPAAGLAALEATTRHGELDSHHLAQAARTELLRRLGRTAAARAGYERALELMAQPAEQRVLRRRREPIGSAATHANPGVDDGSTAARSPSRSRVLERIGCCRPRRIPARRAQAICGPPVLGDAAAMFVIELEYTADLSEIDAHMAAHVAWLQKYYASGNFVVSGRKVPRDGGIILAVGKSREQIEQLIQEDPFNQHGLARFRVIEFRASQRAPNIDRLIQ